MSGKKNTIFLSPLNCQPDPVLSEQAKDEFRGMTAKESTATCDRVVIFSSSMFSMNSAIVFKEKLYSYFVGMTKTWNSS